MANQSVTTVRRPRADAVRNRVRVLEAAKAVFSAGGPDASLEAVARRAGVGIGTLYRHFPTREALFEAVYRREVEHLGELAEQLSSQAAPVEALRRWLRSNVEFVATKKGMVAALALAVHGSSDLYAYTFERLTSTACGCSQSTDRKLCRRIARILGRAGSGRLGEKDPGSAASRCRAMRHRASGGPFNSGKCGSTLANGDEYSRAQSCG
jgi:AcrR family transcriptional regulator